MPVLERFQVRVRGLPSTVAYLRVNPSTSGHQSALEESVYCSKISCTGFASTLAAGK